MSNNVSTRQLDIILEQSVGRFMDDYFYSKLSTQKGIPCRRIYDKPAQLLGIDATIGKLCIDEKVKIKGGYVSKILEYPSFEISFKSQKSGNILDGWFIKDGLKTDYYAFITVFSKETEWQRIRYENIDSLVVLFVHKKSVLEFVGGLDDIKKQSENLRNFNYEDGSLWFNDFKLKLSMQFPEEPVNLVIKRDVLRNLPHSREIRIEKNSFKTLI